jgi:spermidine synthase
VRRCAEVLFALAAWLWVCSALAEPVLIHTERSLYRNIMVYDDNDVRCMKFSRAETSGRQSCQSLLDRARLVFPYTKMMMGALWIEPSPRRILVIGLGGGTLPSALASVLPGAQIDAVEVDLAVIQVAQRFFGFRGGGNMRVYDEDGRVFVKRALRNRQRYDLVMLDAFDHEYIPEHLLTREFLQEVKGLLTEHGVLAANTFSSSKLYDHESVTYEAVFGTFYNLQLNNRVILWRAGGLPSRDVIERNAAAWDAKFRPLGIERDRLLPLFSTERRWKSDARVLTDQYSPSNLLNGR